MRKHKWTTSQTKFRNTQCSLKRNGTINRLYKQIFWAERQLSWSSTQRALYEARSSVPNTTKWWRGTPGMQHTRWQREITSSRSFSTRWGVWSQPEMSVSRKSKKVNFLYLPEKPANLYLFKKRERKYSIILVLKKNQTSMYKNMYE